MPDGAATWSSKSSRLRLDRARPVRRRIVVAASNRVIIATAAHVVLAATRGGHIRVVFHFAPRDTVAVDVDRPIPTWISPC